MENLRLKNHTEGAGASCFVISPGASGDDQIYPRKESSYVYLPIALQRVLRYGACMSPHMQTVPVDAHNSVFLCNSAATPSSPRRNLQRVAGAGSKFEPDSAVSSI